MEFTLYQLLWMFFAYAFLGWCCEVVFAALRHGKFVNRGFLNGPVCPIYGFGVVLVIVCLTPLSEHLLLLFLGSMVLTTTLEYCTGLVLEKLFHAKWWDYSGERFNLHGYVCLEFSILWGLAATGVLKLVAPVILAAINAVPYGLGFGLGLGLLGLILLDLAATVATVQKLQSRVRLLENLAGEIHEVSDVLAERLSDVTLDAKEEVVLYAPLKTMVEAHRSEEKALFEAHRTQEAELLGRLRIEQRELREDRREDARLHRLQTRETFEQKLREKLPWGSGRLLRAFPDLKVHTGQGVVNRLRELLENRK